MNHIVVPQKISAVRKYAKTHRDTIVAVYLYGSTAEGTATVLSDIDLAILLREPLKRDALVIERKAQIAFQRLFEPEVDVRALTEKTSLPFLEEVLRDHVLLAVNDDEYRAEFESRAFARIIDFRPILHEYLAAMQERLQKGTYASQY